ncbi:MAG: FAD-dependent oxidoreductase [Austwickia sp.]|nr:FAD-dependent oxidoreductase [Austwickia sp.]
MPTPSSAQRARIAVVGSGVSGLTAAYLLARRHDVVLYESLSRAGGHAHTHSVAPGPTAPDCDPIAVDSGFIVHNHRTYPFLLKLFAELGVATQPTEMSMSISVPQTGLEYAGGRGLGGVLAQRRRVLDRRFLAMLRQVGRFQREARALVRDPSAGPDQESLADFLTRGGYSQDFLQWYAVPVVACVWSSGASTALEYPARYLFSFLEHHGMLTQKGSPRWYTVVGGSKVYVDAVLASLPDVRLGSPVTAVRRLPADADGGSGAEVRAGGGPYERYDAVVLATHADQALRLLQDPSPAEQEVLGAFRYSTNETVLHRDDSLLPRAVGARASWNYRLGERDEPVTVTYWMNRLQHLPEHTPLLVTLGGAPEVAADQVVARMTYRHPIYDARSVAAQARLPELTTPTTTYAGAYHGWGFHEDGCRSGVAAAAALGVSW